MMVHLEDAMRRLAEDCSLNASIAGFMDCGFSVTLGDRLLAEAAKPHPEIAPIANDAIDRVVADLGITVSVDARGRPAAASGDDRVARPSPCAAQAGSPG